MISARLAGAREDELEPAIEDAERRARPSGTPLAALRLLEAADAGEAVIPPGVGRFPLPAKRELIAGIFTSLVLGPITISITRWAPREERLATWRWHRSRHCSSSANPAWPVGRSALPDGAAEDPSRMDDR